MSTINIRPLAPLDMSDRVRLLTKIQMGNESVCWPWTAGKGSFGHGTIKMRVGDASGVWDLFLATRVTYLLFYDIDPLDQCVLHACDNPPCCNPYHLFLGTLHDNNLDRAKKLRNARTKLTPVLISTVIGWHRQGKSTNEIAQTLSVHPRTIRDVVNGKT